MQSSWGARGRLSRTPAGACSPGSRPACPLGPACWEGLQDTVRRSQVREGRGGSRNLTVFTSQEVTP